MIRARGRHMPIFARTFLLLLTALVLAHGVGMTMALLREPAVLHRTNVYELAGLFATRLPAPRDGLHVEAATAAPAAPDGFHRHAALEAALLRWLTDVQPSDVRIYVATPGPGAPATAPAQSTDPVLPQAFVAAARLGDRHWRVISTGTSPLVAHGRIFVLLLGVGMLPLLPLAWWFSRALAAPIRRFALAADRIDHASGAPPLPLDGPAELVQAARSFNLMQERLGRLVREREQMVGAIAHDLRTPLARLAFRLGELPEPAREAAEADIDEMADMIQSALVFLRDQHQLPQRRPLDLAAQVAEACADLGAGGDEVVFDTRLARAPFNGDAVALRRMLGNLVGNALRFGTRAQVSLWRDGADYVIDVDDDGPGIDPALAEQLFVPFFRGEDSRNRATGGIGIGLASARRVAQEHGGNIQLANRDEGGLRARIRLPAQA